MLTSFQAPATASLLRTFNRFPDLPPEIRVDIWKQAVSDIECSAIRVIVNFDLDQPRALVPSLRVAARDVSSSDDETSECDSNCDWTCEAFAQHQQRIPAMLYVCRESRNLVLDKYHLDLDSIIPDENKLWWNPQEDTIYLPSFEYKLLRRKRLRTSLSSVQHLALPLRKEFLNGFYVLDFINVPTLKSLSLLIDPFGKYDAEGGRIVLHEPYDVPIARLQNMTPSQIEELITAMIESRGYPCDPPSVEVLVMGFGKSKCSRRSG
jgi:hypothetical protein